MMYSIAPSSDLIAKYTHRFPLESLYMPEHSLGQGALAFSVLLLYSGNAKANLTQDCAEHRLGLGFRTTVRVVPYPFHDQECALFHWHHVHLKNEQDSGVRPFAVNLHRGQCWAFTPCENTGMIIDHMAMTCLSYRLCTAYEEFEVHMISHIRMQKCRPKQSRRYAAVLPAHSLVSRLSTTPPKSNRGRAQQIRESMKPRLCCPSTVCHGYGHLLQQTQYNSAHRSAQTDDQYFPTPAKTKANVVQM